MRLPRIALPHGVLWVLYLLAGLYLANLILAAIGVISLSNRLALIPASVWVGELWRVFTYMLLAAGLLDLLISGIMLAWIGSQVCRVWRATEFLIYCGFCGVAAGMIACLILPGSHAPIGGPSVMIAGLLVAWARLFGHERVRLTQTCELSRFHLVMLIGGAMLVLSAAMGAWMQAIILFAAGVAGWSYLSLRWKAIHNQPARAVDSKRMNRLEL